MDKGFVIIYSITSKTSFDQVNTFSSQILRVKDVSSLPVMLAGNKCDLVDKREVSELEGRNYSIQNGFQFKETSAKTRLNVEEVFYDLVRLIRNYYSSVITKKIINKKSKCTLV